MRKTLLFICWLMVPGAINAQSPTLQWAKKMGSTSNEEGRSVAVDASGNIYTTGTFSGTVDFNPGPGTYNLTSGGYSDAFITKLDASGNFVWAKSLTGNAGGNHAVYANSIALDVSGGIYVTGSFSGVVDFDPGAITFYLVSAGQEDIFISKFDTNGSLTWAKSMEGSQNDKGLSITVDTLNNVYTTGCFSGFVDFNPDLPIYSFSAVAGQDIFISKLNSSGNFVWAKSIGGTLADVARSIKVDMQGNVYTTGSFQGTADFDPGAGTFSLTAMYNDIFISKLDASGNFVWAKRMGGSMDDTGRSIAIDAWQNVYITGYFQDVADFDPGTGTYSVTCIHVYCSFITKLDAFGNLLWAKVMDGGYLNQAMSIVLDASQNVYTTGIFQGTVDFDPGPGVFDLTAVLLSIYIVKLDVTGNFDWAKNISGTSNVVSNAITIDTPGNVYLTGYFGGTINFEPGAGVSSLSAAGLNDIFVLKMSYSSVGLDEKTTINDFKIYPNPNSGVFSIDLNADTRIIVTNLLGQEILDQQKLPGKHFLNISGHNSGIYFIQLLSDEKIIATKKIIKE
ncbi:MAG: T9SS type A sorting domain-containing protein [Chitinophagaceae bacterium]|nr:T9SS type A sorting domain-containing protein [Chitinophagaceae bacterium]